MNKPAARKLRCAVYTRKSSEEGLEQEFNSLDAQREACEAYIASQRSEGWVLIRDQYDDGGISGGTLDRPALRRLLSDIEDGLVDVVVVYKIDRLSRSLMDFSKLVEVFDRNNVTFVSVTQSFNTTTSMGRLTLNILLSFAQFEREVTAERIRDKVKASRMKGIFMGGTPPYGYKPKDRKLVIDEEEARNTRWIFSRFVEIGSATKLAQEVARKGIRTPRGNPMSKNFLYRMLNNRAYIGEAVHKGTGYAGEHQRLIDQKTWDRVHSILQESPRIRANNTRTENPALLKGLLYGEDGAAFSPTHTRKWVVEDSTVQNLRTSGAWNNISDRIALFAEYARSAEHSAQQDSSRLRRYEQEFKDGRINILNCSTTMEMGVDIGSVSSVMMTNVPPSIANYRQRVGRAGRRGQAIAVGFTFCKDRPLDREAFRDPQAYLSRTLSAPRVSLSSRPIVQRHVNALLLSRFMAERSGNAVKMQIGAFLGCPSDSKLARPATSERPVQDYIDWLTSPETTTSMSEPIRTLVRRSVLDGDSRLIADSRSAIEALEESFVSEWIALVSMAKDEGAREAGKARMEIEIRRLCGEFLLGALADRGYLPGYGFPTDVVSFMPAAEFRPSSESASDGNRQFRSVGPQRSLDLAIRDYAPGSEVVLDGLVHKSSGVTLNWKRPASEENVAEIQSIRFAWHCTECGAADIQRGGYPIFCPSCGSEGLHSTEFLRPAGFAVDPRVRPHAETDSVSFVAPEDPVVSTRDSEWNNLPLPELGRYRSSREGLVYFSNKGGPNGAGFAICLHCGRAEADSDNRGLVAPPPILVGHKPLRYRKGEDVCPGNDRPFSIKRNIALGLEITTDVFELQPRQPISRSGANALVIALREALAQELGVEADEMGFAAVEAQNAFGAAAVSLFIFDRATGGAGFAVSFEDRIKAVITRAERILDCKTPGCEKACAGCVLTSDAPTGKDELDRTVALKFLREHLVFPAGLSVDDRFSEDSEISLSPLREIARELVRSPHSELSIFVPDGFSPSELSAWRLSTEFQEWTKRGHVVQLVLTSENISSMSSAERLSLRDFSVAHGVVLHLGTPPELSNRSHPLIVISSLGRPSQIWATRDADAAVPGSKWGQPTDHPIVHGTSAVTLSLKSIDLNSLLPPPGAHLVQIGAELDGSISTFGLRFSELLVEALKKCGIWSNGSIRKAVYRDPYVSSPLVARLLIDTTAKLSELSGSKDPSLLVETRVRGGEMRGDPWQISHDWRDGDQQRRVLESLGRTRGLKVQVQYADVPHGRYLEIIFDGGKSAMVVLDQGFGAWAPPRTVVVKHDFCSDVDTETKRLAIVNSLLERRGPGKTYVVAAPGKT